MSDASAPIESTRSSLFLQDPGTQKRSKAEKRFRLYGLTAIAVGLAFLAFLLVVIVKNGLPAFQQTFITLNVEILETKVDKNGNRDPAEMAKVSTFGYNPLLDAALAATLTETGIENPFEKAKELRALLSKSAAAQVRDFVLRIRNALARQRHSACSLRHGLMVI